MAYGLLAIAAPWEALCARATVSEVESMIAGAIWREGVRMDELAWQTAYLMSAAGSKPAPEHELSGMRPPPRDVWTAEKLLGRPRLALDPRGRAEPEAEAAADAANDGRPDWDEATRREKAERARLMLAMAQAQKSTATTESTETGP